MYYFSLFFSSKSGEGKGPHTIVCGVASDYRRIQEHEVKKALKRMSNDKAGVSDNIFEV